MNSFNFSSGPGFGNLSRSESWMEIGLAVAAAAFSVAIWLLADARPGDRFEAATRVTFPTVIVSAPR
ncbi:MAG: hypothetical protein Q8Q73_12005 [Stagnimonas sp.]|nr:hypothetical protein [Stagnimonas sp.]